MATSTDINIAITGFPIKTMIFLSRNSPDIKRVNRVEHKISIMGNNVVNRLIPIPGISSSFKTIGL